MIIDHNFKGFRLEVDEKTGEFRALGPNLGEPFATHKTLEGLKAVLEKSQTATIGKVWVGERSYQDDTPIVVGKITSLKPRERGDSSVQYRVQYGKSWAFLHASQIFKDTEANRARIVKINSLLEQVATLRKKISKERELLENFQEGELPK